MTEGSMEARRGARENLSEIKANTGELFGHASEAVGEAVGKGVVMAEGVGENFTSAVRDMLHNRVNTVMLKVDDATLKSIDTLVEARIVNSRSEGAAFLVMEGIKHRKPLFDAISDKIDAIRQAREDLQSLLGNADAQATEPVASDVEDAGANSE